MQFESLSTLSVPGNYLNSTLSSFLQIHAYMSDKKGRMHITKMFAILLLSVALFITGEIFFSSPRISRFLFLFSLVHYIRASAFALGLLSFELSHYQIGGVGIRRERLTPSITLALRASWAR